MSVRISYAYTCSRGKVRKNNEDNFWVMGNYLEKLNGGMATIVEGETWKKTVPAFAVFDGMGGESSGETAAFLAAETFQECYEEDGGDCRDYAEEFLEETCLRMNHAVCQYAAQNRIACMGTTAAVLMCARDRISICNVGDSRVYQIYEDNLRQISRDHVAHMNGNCRKAPLTQYIGLPEEEARLVPYVVSGAYHSGDRYLICTDGLTDMLDEGEICQIVQSCEEVKDAVFYLLRAAMERGGKDNTTIILCEIQEEKSGKWYKRF